MAAQVRSIDLARFESGDPAARREQAAIFDQAGRETGFLTITGHGVAPALLDDCFAAAARFFAWCSCQASTPRPAAMMTKTMCGMPGTRPRPPMIDAVSASERGESSRPPTPVADGGPRRDPR